MSDTKVAPLRCCFYLKLQCAESSVPLMSTTLGGVGCVVVTVSRSLLVNWQEGGRGGVYIVFLSGLSVQKL